MNEAKRLEELMVILESECGKYENDCDRCPYSTECNEYCKISGILEIVNN